MEGEMGKPEPRFLNYETRIIGIFAVTIVKHDPMRPFFSLALLLLLSVGLAGFSCSDKNPPPEPPPLEEPDPVIPASLFAMGVDLSYVNQIEDHGGVYRDSGEAKDPFAILKSLGANTVRVRLWHHPQWVREVYGDPAKPLYSGYGDVVKSIRRAKDLKMAVLLDFHYSDFWADPGRQEPPRAWENITSLNVLKDSVYNYTFTVLRNLDNLGLMPEMVQIGNETNCGFMMTGTKSGFPVLNACNGQWQNLGILVNSAISAVRDASAPSAVKPEIALHVADPKNLEWWFSKVVTDGGISDFDIIGFSWYPLWHTTIPLGSLPALVKKMKTTYDKKVMVLETAYPWSISGADNYNNQFGSQKPLTGFPFNQQGQLDFMLMLTQEMISAGASGVFYWEPAWITSGMKDSWGTGSSWENAAFFDFQGNTLPVTRYLSWEYKMNP